jgi:DNA-binding NarL/FixJ family response regulator
MSTIRVLVADDHAILRAGIRLLLETQREMVVVAEAENAAGAVDQVHRYEPDVVVLDISMPGGGTIDAIQRLALERPRTRVLVLTMHDDESYLRACLAAGAAGYLVKSAADDELVNAVRAVHAGRSYVGVSLGPGRLSRMVGPRGVPPARLSAREREVLDLVAYGHTNTEIASRLGIGVKSVESYRARVYEKLGFQSRTDLVRYAVGTGLMRPERLSDAES